MTLIKKTKSLSPLTGQIVGAEIVSEDGRVYLIKRDEEGKEYRGLLEADVNLYNQLTRNTRVDQVPAYCIYIHATSSCNLNCSLCYEPPDRKGIHITPRQVEKIVSPYRKKNVFLAGREPTCNPHLKEIINIVSKRNYCFLLTNGLRLVDPGYLLSLKEAGLHRIIFSFNGFSDEVYRKINGAPLLQEKLHALDNIRKQGISTEISATIVRGVNEDQIRKLFTFSLENLSWIRGLRIRSASPMGKHLGNEWFPVSELMKMTSSATGFSEVEILKAGNFVQLFGETFDVAPLQPRLCSLTFFLRTGRRAALIGSGVDSSRISDSKIKKFKMIFHIIFEYWKLIWSHARIREKFGRRPGFRPLKVELRSWPNIFTIDLIEDRKCTTRCFYGTSGSGEGVPFCYNNILRSYGRGRPVNCRSQEKEGDD